MKCTIHEGLSGKGLPDRVPPSYREMLRKAIRPGGTYTLLLFAHTPRDVVTSRPVRQAFRRLSRKDGETLLALGTTFTEEARALIEEQGGTILEQKKGKWTDASAAERQL